MRPPGSAVGKGAMRGRARIRSHEEEEARRSAWFGYLLAIICIREWLSARALGILELHGARVSREFSTWEIKLQGIYVRFKRSVSFCRNVVERNRKTWSPPRALRFNGYRDRCLLTENEISLFWLSCFSFGGSERIRRDAARAWEYYFSGGHWPDAGSTRVESSDPCSSESPSDYKS